MSRLALEVADIFRRHAQAYREAHADSLSRGQRRVMSAIECCRTSALGGHLEQCDACGYQRNAFNSCRNRHCPKCQSLARAQWLEEREAELLDCEYFHVVFTIPQQLAAIAFQNKPIVYDILFHATAETLTTIAADPQHLGARIGFMALLHTWGQTLMHHPHLHCVVPGGGLSPDGSRWIACPKGFFLPVKVLSRLFRRLFLEQLQKAFDAGKLQFFSSLEALRDPQVFRRHLDPVRNVKWVVYAKAPFAGPQQGVDYVGRYTHRVAISNHRILDIEDGQVKFHWRDYRDNNQQKTMPRSLRETHRSLSAGMPGLPSWPDDHGPVIAQSSFSSGHPKSLWLIRATPNRHLNKLDTIESKESSCLTSIPNPLCRPTSCYLLLLALPEAPWKHSPQNPSSHNC
jgi:putative transposase/transposase-like zinc-binding protein